MNRQSSSRMLGNRVSILLCRRTSGCSEALSIWETLPVGRVVASIPSVPCVGRGAKRRSTCVGLNEQERWEETCNALEQLEHFGDELIPGLIECRRDGNPDVRHQAVNLLAAARPRSNVAVLDLIGMLQDEDWLIVTSTMLYLGAFGSLATAAIPQIETWLESPNEFIRLQAASTILKLDPDRKEFLPMIWEATESDHPVMKSFARDFFLP